MGNIHGGGLRVITSYSIHYTKLYEKELDRFFHRKVQYLFNLLLQDSDIKKFVKMLSTEQDGIRRLIDG